MSFHLFASGTCFMTRAEESSQCAMLGECWARGTTFCTTLEKPSKAGTPLLKWKKGTVISVFDLQPLHSKCWIAQAFWSCFPSDRGLLALVMKWTSQDWLSEGIFFFLGIALCHLVWLHYFFLSNVFLASPNLWTTLCYNPEVCMSAFYTLTGVQIAGICPCAMLYHNQPNVPSSLQTWQLARTRATAQMSPKQWM